MELKDTIAPLLILGGIAVAAYAVKTYLVDPAGQAGAWIGEHVITPVYYTAQYPGTAWQGLLEGFAPPAVPPTPEGYLPSNWTWDVGAGISLGLPAGMTPGQFCAGSPASPICVQLGLPKEDVSWQGPLLRWLNG